IWARGLAVSLTNASTIAFPMSFVTVMNTPVALGFTPAVVFVALAFLAGWLILSRLPIGMRIYALGGDPRMLRQAGVSDKRLRVIVLVIKSLFTSASMILMLRRGCGAR